MGDRAQIIVEYEHGQRIHLYTHWEGHRLVSILTEGLIAGHSRWNDPAYLTRILFCRMVRKDGLHDETGFGISPEYQDSNASTDLIVDTVKREVRYLAKAWTFSEFIALDGKTWSDIE